MKKVNGYENADSNVGGQFETLPAGGYICMIKSVEDATDKEYLKIEFDIVDGPHRGWFTEIYKRAGFWGGKLIRSYKDSALGFFKGFITSIEESNPGYKWAWSEQSLANKKIGLVLAYEEYLNRDNNIRERIYVAQNRSVSAINAGDFTVPDVKKLSQRPAGASLRQREPGEEIPVSDKMPWDD